jgi:hypothetical protein
MVSPEQATADIGSCAGCDLNDRPARVGAFDTVFILGFGEHDVSSISTEIFSRTVGQSAATNILTGKPRDDAKDGNTAAGETNPLVALLSSGADEDDDDHTYDASGRTSGTVRISAGSAAGIEGIDADYWMGDENGNPLPVKLEVRIGDKIVARVFEGGGSIVANGFDPAAIKIGHYSDGIEGALTPDELADFRMSQVMKFFSGMGATFETFSNGQENDAGSNSGEKPTDGLFAGAAEPERDDEDADAGDAAERTVVPQGMTLSEILALSDQDYIAALEREKHRVSEAAQFAMPQPKAGDALRILQETASVPSDQVKTVADGSSSFGWLEFRPSGATVFRSGNS